MSDLVPAEAIEQLVGVARHDTQHWGRAAADGKVYVLHSRACKESGIDLRACAYSVALDRGITPGTVFRWQAKFDEPVQLTITAEGDLEPLWACAVCGCTDESACPGGCAWTWGEHPVPTPICTTCDLLTHVYDAEHWFPFVETENGDIAGPGHQDKAAFAAAVSAFDELASGEASRPWDTDDITHQWARWDDKEFGQFRLCAQGEPDAFPVTTIWGAR